MARIQINLKVHNALVSQLLQKRRKRDDSKPIANSGLIMLPAVIFLLFSFISYTIKDKKNLWRYNIDQLIACAFAYNEKYI